MKIKFITLSLIFLGLMAFTVKDKSANPNVEIAKKVFEYFNKHDWQKMAELYIENAEYKDPALGTGIVKQTRQQTIEKYKQLEKMSPDIKDEVIAIYPSGNTCVIVEFVSSGTAGGTKWTLPICTIFKMKDGKIIQDFTYYDNQ